MTPLAMTPDAWAGSQLLGAAGLGALGFYYLLPRPSGRSVALGTFFALAAAVLSGTFLVGAFGKPSTDLVEQVLFWLFSAGAVGFGAVLVTQVNPARGAIAFAFVILSSCGLFLLLAAPFLMAATVIVYAGAVIVTFVFLLMLSHVSGPSDENDRTREPLLGSLAGFAFAGLVLFALHRTEEAVASEASPLPVAAIRPQDRAELAAAIGHLDQAVAATDADAYFKAIHAARTNLAEVVGPDPAGHSVPDRLDVASRDGRVYGIVAQSMSLRTKADKLLMDADDNLMGNKPDLDRAQAAAKSLRDDALILSGRGDLPARNIANVGYLMYTEHLLAVEMAGTLLLVATIGAVAIAGRKGVAA